MLQCCSLHLYTDALSGRTETAAAIRDSISNSCLVLWILIKIFSGLMNASLSMQILEFSFFPVTLNFGDFQLQIWARFCAPKGTYYLAKSQKTGG